MHGLLLELRFALRRLARRPGISLLAVLLLGVGLGGDLALLGVVDAMLFRRPPVAEPERLVRIVKSDAKRQYFDNWSFSNANDLRRNATTLADAAIFADWRVVQLAIGKGPSLRLRSSIVSGDYFRVLGARPALGRLLAPSDDGPGSPPVVVLGHELWRTRFGADPEIVGRELRLNGHEFSVVGVAPRGLASLDPTMAPQVWLPMATWRQAIHPQHDVDLLANRGSSWLDLVGRLAPGATLVAAQTELEAVAVRLAKAYPDQMGDVEPWVMSLDDAAAGGPGPRGHAERRALLVAAVGLLVLFAVAANLAALLAARAAQSRHESAVRAALGADRWRLRLPLAAEGALLTAAGALVGFAVAGALRGFAVRSLEFVLPLASGDSLALLGSPRMLASAVALVGATLAVVSALPGRAAARIEVVPALRGEPSSRGRRRWGPADALVVVQVALSVLLLTAAALLASRFRALSSIAPEFEPRGVVQASFDLALQGYDATRAARFESELVERLEARFGEGRIAFSDWPPLVGGWSRTSIAAADAPRSADGRPPNADIANVSPQLFRVLGIRLLRGRLLAEEDTSATRPVAVINEVMARRYFGGRAAIGETFWLGDESGPEIEVVGVVADARFRDLASPVPPMFFQSLGQRQAAEMQLTLLVRSAAPAAPTAAAIRTAAAELDPELPLYRLGALDEQLADSIGTERTSAQLFGGFAALVLALAAAGLAALSLAAVARRRREIGIRVALGALGGDVLRALLGRAATLLALGAAAGGALTVAALPALKGLASGEVEIDPVAALAAGLALAAAALLATWLPARRALAVDPAEVLRSE